MKNDELTKREKETLKFIVYYRKNNFGISPTERQVFQHLNKTLPPKERLSSHVQIVRVVQYLRNKGMLLDPKNHKELAGKHRILVPTPQGEKVGARLK